MDDEGRDGHSVDDEPSGLLWWMLAVAVVVIGLIVWGCTGHLLGGP